MKLKIRYKLLTTVQPPEINPKGDWIDLFVPKYHGTSYKTGDLKKINLGIAMQLPKGMEAILAFRSSTSGNYNISMPNGIGVIDNTYCGNDDVWKLPFYAMADGSIPGGVRLCQFRIQPSQKATVWQKLKYLLSSGIVLEEAENLSDDNRGGFGKGTGK